MQQCSPWCTKNVQRCFGNGDVSDSDEVDTPEAVTSPPAMKEPTWYTPYRRVENSVAVVQVGSVHQGFFGDPNLNRSEFG